LRNSQGEKITQPPTQWDFEETATTPTQQPQIIIQTPQLLAEATPAATPTRDDLVRRSSRPRRAPARFSDEN